MGIAGEPGPGADSRMVDVLRDSSVPKAREDPPWVEGTGRMEADPALGGVGDIRPVWPYASSVRSILASNEDSSAEALMIDWFRFDEEMVEAIGISTCALGFTGASGDNWVEVAMYSAGGIKRCERSVAEQTSINSALSVGGVPEADAVGVNWIVKGISADRAPVSSMQRT